MTSMKTVSREFRIQSSREEVPGVVREITGYLEESSPVSGCDCLFDMKVVLNNGV